MAKLMSLRVMKELVDNADPDPGSNPSPPTLNLQDGALGLYLHPVTDAQKPLDKTLFRGPSDTNSSLPCQFSPWALVEPLQIPWDSFPPSPAS